MRPLAAGQRSFLRTREADWSEVLQGHVDNRFSGVNHGDKGIIGRMRPTASPSHGNNLDWFLGRLIVYFHHSFLIQRRKFLRFFLGIIRHNDTALENSHRGIGQVLRDASNEASLHMLDILPRVVGKQMSVVCDIAMQFQTQVKDGRLAQIMLVPHVVATRVEVLAVDRNQLGVVPRNAVAPGADPQEDVGIGGQVACQLFQDCRAVDRHS